MGILGRGDYRARGGMGGWLILFAVSFVVLYYKELHTIVLS